MVSRLKREISKRKFDRLDAWMSSALSLVDKEAFVRMAWAVWGLQQEVPVPAAQLCVCHPPEAVSSKYSNPWRVHPWEWETLINLLVATPRNTARQAIPCNDIRWARQLAAHLRKLEDVESATYLDDANIKAELHRLGQRQFAWQSGFLNQADMYRYLYLYAQGTCADFFATRYGISIEEFTKAGFALFAALSNSGAISRSIDFSEIGVSQEVVNRTLQIMALPIGQSEERWNELNDQIGNLRQPVGYRPSILREHPILAFGKDDERLRAPLPTLIILRMTAGLYYDLQGAPGGIRNEIAKRFETYCTDFIRHMTPGFLVEPEYRYRATAVRKNVATPDILLSRRRDLELVIECKATKLTFGAQFSLSPSEAAASKYDELAKGIFQIWRFYADCRQGRTQHVINESTRALVLTVDSWMVLSRELQEHALKIAREKAASEDDMIDADQRPVVFATIQYFERLLRTSNEDELLATIEAAAVGGFLGWSLPSVRAEGEVQALIAKEYPFDIGNLIPWWRELF